MIETPETYKESDYYDGVFAKDLEWYTDDPEVCQYYPIWKRMIKRIKGKVIDVGCGVGQGAQLMVRSDKEFVLGVDFSPVAIQKAKERNPELEFVCADIMEFDFGSYEYDTIYSSETFEHLLDDYAFLDRIPVGKHMVISVPNAHALGHARHFEGPGDVIKHYESHIDIQYATQYRLVNMIFYVISGERRDI